MPVRHAFVLAFGLGACASASPLAPTPGRTAPSTAEVELSATIAAPTGSDGAQGASAAPVEPEPTALVAPPPIMPPNGAVCFLRGTGDPFSRGCPGDPALVTARKDGAQPIAQFGRRAIDVTWAFFEGNGRPWVGARSGGLTLTGFVDARKERFMLVREIAAIDGHVWFEPGSPVRVRGGKGRGIDINIEDDMAGVESIVANTPCDTISYDPKPKLVAAGPRAPATQFATPRRSVLPLRLTPGGPILTTLREDAEPLPIGVDVLEKAAGSTRIAIETTSARFDVWVSDGELRTDGGRGIGSSGSAGCGGVTDYGVMTLFDVVEDTRVVVAHSPDGGSGPDGLTLGKGTTVTIRSRQNGFAEISSPFSVISPPTDLAFWVPEAILRPHVSRRRE